MEKESLYVVILNWNGWSDTIECLKSIHASNKRGLEIQIIVVDNGSTDDSILKIEKATKNDSSITLIKNSNNLGFSGGNNVGIKYALNQNASYVCLLNNDTVVSTDFFIEIYKFLKTHTNIGALSPKIYFYKGYEFHKDRYMRKDLGRVIWYGGGIIDWSNIYGSNAHVDEVDNHTVIDGITDFATGACFISPAAVLREAGLLNEKYYLYLEDTDLSMRIKNKGYDIWFASKPFIYHKVSQASSIGSDLNDYFITRNRLIFGMKYAPIRAKQALIRESIRFLFSGRRWQKKGVLDFYRRRFYKGSWGQSKKI